MELFACDVLPGEALEAAKRAVTADWRLDFASAAAAVATTGKAADHQSFKPTGAVVGAGVGEW